MHQIYLYTIKIVLYFHKNDISWSCRSTTSQQLAIHKSDPLNLSTDCQENPGYQWGSQNYRESCRDWDCCSQSCGKISCCVQGNSVIWWESTPINNMLWGEDCCSRSGGIETIAHHEEGVKVINQK